MAARRLEDGADVSAFASYQDAVCAARVKADEMNRDVGLEAASEFGRKVYRIFLLPREDMRSGHELRCEVVKPGEPR